MPIRITKRDVDALIRSPGRPQLSDTQPGLVLRKKAGTAAWYFRLQADGLDRLVSLGTIAELPIEDARRLASDMLYDVGRGILPDDEYVGRKRVALSLDDEIVVASGKPSFMQAQNDFLSFVRSDRAAKTYVDYSAALREPLLKPLHGKGIDRVSREELAEIVDAVSRSGRQRSAAKLAAILSSMWTFLTHDSHIRKYGVTRGMLVRFKPLERAGKTRELKTPSPAEVKALLDRRGEVPPVVADAIAFLAYTAQRRLTVVTARREHFREEEGVLLWFIPKTLTKSKRQHIVPVPDEVRGILTKTETGFLFPSGNADRISEWTLSHTFRDLNVGFTPHDVRRAFTNEVRRAGFDRNDPKLILDHAEGSTGDVTLAHYDFWREVTKKRKILLAWTSALDGKRRVRKAA